MGKRGPESSRAERIPAIAKRRMLALKITPVPKVDGLPEEAHIAVVTLLREITRAGFVYPDYLTKT